MTDLHCSECGALGRESRSAIGESEVICPNDDCPQIIIAILSRPIEYRELHEALARREEA